MGRQSVGGGAIRCSVTSRHTVGIQSSIDYWSTSSLPWPLRPVTTINRCLTESGSVLYILHPVAPNKGVASLHLNRYQPGHVRRHGVPSRVMGLICHTYKIPQKASLALDSKEELDRSWHHHSGRSQTAYSGLSKVPPSHVTCTVWHTIIVQLCYGTV
jgi:hypothetical protein